VEVTYELQELEERLRTAVRRSDAGAGLVGVIVAMVLLSVGVLSVSSALTQSLAMQTITDQRTSALSIARAKMEDIRAMAPEDVIAESVASVNEYGVPDVNGVFTLEVTIGDPGRNLLSVTVIVTAPRSNPIQLVTWIYDGEF